MSLYVSVFNFFMNHESKQTNPLQSYVLCSDSSRGRISCSSCSLTREREREKKKKKSLAAVPQSLCYLLILFKANKSLTVVSCAVLVLNAASVAVVVDQSKRARRGVHMR
jgi:hypothetical protein